MTEMAVRESNLPTTYLEDPTGGRLVAWAQAASAANQLAKALVSTTFVPQAFKGNVGDATAVILMGDELGLSPLAALRSIYAVHGTPALYARTMVALAQAHGHEVWTDIDTPAKVVVCGRRKGSDNIERSEWTIERARRAGYTSNKKYESNPQEMLYAKAASVVARKVAADVLAGVPYSVEDLELEQPAETTTVRRGETAAPARTAKRATAAPPPAMPEPEFDEPATATNGEPVAADGDDTLPIDPLADGITSAQSKKLHATFRDFNISTRDDKIRAVSALVGRPVESSGHLTKDEATTLIDTLDSILNREDPRSNLDAIVEMAESKQQP